jgi:hypothetical protein
MHPIRTLALVLIALGLGAAQLDAQGATGKFLLGATAAFGLHEGGHLGTALAFGRTPGLRRVEFGPIPFFAVTHDPVSPIREYAISAAGFWSQQITSEILLTRYPDLRKRDAPFLKGMFAFHLVTSAGYSAVAFAREGPSERDTRGMSESVRVSEPVIGAVILAPAAIDALRYYYPENRWLRWIGRGAKLGGVLLLLRADDAE